MNYIKPDLRRRFISGDAFASVEFVTDDNDAVRVVAYLYLRFGLVKKVAIADIRGAVIDDDASFLFCFGSVIKIGKVARIDHDMTAAV